MTAKPDRTDPVPENFNWDLWLGVCANRPFIGGEYYHPENWRKRWTLRIGRRNSVNRYQGKPCQIWWW